MKADKKILIKVKSKTEQRIMEDPKVEMITTWNIKRITYAILVLLIVIILLVYYLSQSGNKNNQRLVMPIPTVKQKIHAPVNHLMTDKKRMPIKTIQPEVSNKISVIKIDKISQIIPKLQNKKLIKIEILNPHLTRARLAKEVNDLEPYGEVKLPIIINKYKAQGIFYFTDIVKMKGNTVFHEWLKQDKPIYKRKFIIRGNRWRVSTSKLFDINSSGKWQVRLITQSGEILHKINFRVEK